MVFSSPAFLFYFLPAVLVLVLMARSVQWRNAVLLVASLIFYAWGEPAFVLLLLASSAMAYGFGLAIAARRNSRLIFFLAIAWQLGTLIVAKYWDFLALSAQSIGIGLPVLGIPLPIGISFFTFQAISYLVDVRRGHAEAATRFDQVLLYISMFPQLIAGPIVRYRTIDGQLTRLAVSASRRLVGAQLFVIGLAQKTLIANEVGPLADIAFAQGAMLDWNEAWIGLIAYTLQIYFDFSGYSNMAIGLGLIFGFSFPRNFRDPYTALSVTDFWRRWHMSLSRWFRDYLYIPLGGNRSGPWRTYANLLIVFTLCGIWHGAAWTFVFWGLWHGTFLIFERVVDLRRMRLFGVVYTLLVVMLGWVFFRAESFGDALVYLSALFGQSGDGAMSVEMILALQPTALLALLVGSAFALTRTSLRKRVIRTLGRGVTRHMATHVGISVLFALALLSVASGAYNPFLYFRF